MKDDKRIIWLKAIQSSYTKGIISEKKYKKEVKKVREYQPLKINKQINI